MEHTESFLIAAVGGIKLAVEAAGAIVIALGCLRAIAVLLGDRLVRRKATDFTSVRLSLARFLALGLEFQLAADILVTAIAPSWEEIGKLAAIAAIRTILNLALAREMKEEREELAAVGD